MSNYNPYDAAKSIVENKQKWTNAKAKGEDPTQFANDAVAFYEQLRSNGRSDVADYLQKSDAIEAAEYLKKLKGDYKPTVEGTQQKSNEVFETGKAYGQDIKQSFDTVYKNNINVDPTSTGYGKNIRAGYQGAANGAYKSTLAGGADDNNGNVDSFAAANANRQKAAIISQGNDDILKFYDTIAGRANEWVGNKANALSGNLSQLQGNVDSDREMIVQDKNADLVAEQTAADKLKSLYDYLGTSEKADADRYGAEKDLEGVQYKADKDLEGTKYKANSDYAGVVYKTDNDKNKSGNGYAATTSQIISAALNNKDDEGNVLYGKSDEHIQKMLEDTSVSDVSKKELADAYYQRTGRRVKARTPEEVYASPYVSALLTDITNYSSGNDEKTLNQIASSLESGYISDYEAKYVLEKLGYDTSDLEV